MQKGRLFLYDVIFSASIQNQGLKELETNSIFNIILSLIFAMYGVSISGGPSSSFSVKKYSLRRIRRSHASQWSTRRVQSIMTSDGIWRGIPETTGVLPVCRRCVGSVDPRSWRASWFPHKGKWNQPKDKARAPLLYITARVSGHRDVTTRRKFTHRPLHKADRHALVPAHGILPPEVMLKAIPYGLGVRVKTICSEEGNYRNHREAVKDNLVNRGYVRAFVEKELTMVDIKDREELMVRWR